MLSPNRRLQDQPGFPQNYYYICHNQWVSDSKDVSLSNGEHPRSGRQMRGPLQSFDLEAEVLRLRAEKEWQEGRRNAMILPEG